MVLGPLERMFVPAVIHDAGATQGEQLLTFIAATYNILSAKYSGYNSYCPAEHLAWSYREPRILAELSAVQAHILCLQEVDQSFYQGALQAWMQAHGYTGWFRARRVGPVAGPPEGIALLVKCDTFDVLHTDTVHFPGAAPSLAGLPDRLQGTAAWAALQSFHEGAVAALLRHRASGRLVLAASTHLHWDPQNPHIKLLQAALLSHALARIAGEGVATATGTSSSRGSKDRDASCTILGSMEGQIHGSEVLLVLGGDFNSIAQKYLPDRFDPEIPDPPGYQASGVYTYMQSAAVAPSHPDHPCSRAGSGSSSSSSSSGADTEAERAAWCDVLIQSPWGGMSSAYAQGLGSEPPLTTRTRLFAATLDYVWLCQARVTAASLQPKTLTERSSSRSSAIARPSAISPSDGSTQLQMLGTLAMPYAQVAAWCDPLTDVDMPTVPNENYPSDHLLMAAELALTH